jgi:hypothetical protein
MDGFSAPYQRRADIQVTQSIAELAKPLGIAVSAISSPATTATRASKG